MTIQDYFNRLPEPYRTQAIRNTSGKKLKKHVNSLWSAVYYAFPHSDTPEGAEYWHSIASGEFPNQSTTESQCSRIIAYLQTGKSLTRLEADRKFQCMELPQRIYDLKEKGYNIDTTKWKHLPNGKKVKDYRLIIEE